MEQADFTIADVLAWARTKPADGSYDYIDSGNCALCHFLRETGRSASPRVSPYLDQFDDTAGWRNAGEPSDARRPYPHEMEHALSGSETFGELVKRLQELAPETPITPSNWLAIDAYMADIESVLA